MRVKAAAGLAVPREDAPRTYITDKDYVDVDITPYYLRRLADGDLVEDVAPAKPKAKAKEEPKTDAAA